MKRRAILVVWPINFGVCLWLLEFQ